MPRIQGNQSERVEALDEQGDGIARPTACLPRGVGKPGPVGDGEQLLGARHPIRPFAGGPCDTLQCGTLRTRQGAQGVLLPLGHGHASRAPGVPRDSASIAHLAFNGNAHGK